MTELRQFVCEGPDVEGDLSFDSSLARRAYEEANKTHRVVLGVLGDNNFGPPMNCPRRDGDNCRTMMPGRLIDDSLLQRPFNQPEGGHPITHTLDPFMRKCNVVDQIRALLDRERVADAIDWENEYDVRPYGLKNDLLIEYRLIFNKKGTEDSGLGEFQLKYGGGKWHASQSTLLLGAYRDEKLKIDSAIAWANKKYPHPTPEIFKVD